MATSAVMDGYPVDIVSITGNGSTAYVAFVDRQGNLRVVRKSANGGFTSATSADSVIGTDARVY